MLNINDIEKLHKDFPEPEEVGKIRRAITTAFNDLVFDPVPHTYTVKEGGKVINLPSVSSIAGSFEEKKDWDMIAENYAIKNGMLAEDVKRMWRENNIRSTNNGTSTHLFLESYMWFFLGEYDKIDPIIKPQFEDGWLIPYGNKQTAGAKYFEDMYKSYYDDNVQVKVYPVIPETRMYVFNNNSVGIKKRFAGTMDILLCFQDPNDGIWKLICDDWKTNGDLTNSFNRNKGNRMLYPFDNYIDEPFSHYTVQLSAYTLMLNQLKYQVPYRNLVWLKEDQTYERYPITDESKKLIEYYKVF